MHDSSSSRRSAARLSSFTVATLWHRRLARTRPAASGSPVKVQPRVSAELILHPVVTHGVPAASERPLSKSDLDGCNAA
jgi:hypothetical protein